MPLPPLEAILRKNSWVHVVRYRGEPRDDYGEYLEPRLGKDMRVQVLVRLFKREDEEKHSFRWFVFAELEIE